MLTTTSITIARGQYVVIYFHLLFDAAKIGKFFISPQYL